MSVQRRRGQVCKVWKTVKTIDRRGNEVKMAVEDGPHTRRAAFIPQRSARAELPGQQQINITRMLVNADMPDVDLWSRVEWDGKMWDFVTPPSLHYGSRRTRHWSVDLRERP